MLDKVVDKVVSECNRAIKDSGKIQHQTSRCVKEVFEGLDPLNIDDITIPFSLDTIKGLCGDTNPCSGILSAICACFNKTR